MKVDMFSRKFGRQLHLLSVASLVAVTALGLAPAANAATITVSTTADDGINGNCSLREAIRAANSNVAVDGCTAGSSGADTIVLSAGIYSLTIAGKNENLAATGDFDINEDLTIVGVNATTTTISANGVDRVFEISANVTAQVSNITIQNGSPGDADGGGVLINSGSTLILTNTVVRSNSVGFVSVDNKGGGIYNLGGALTLTNSSVISNTASNSAGLGGGIYNQGGTITLTDSIIRGNGADFSGGGIYNFQGTLMLTNSTVSDNWAGFYSGGGINNFGGTLILTNSTVSGNGASNGGGIYNSGTMTISASSVISNTIFVDFQGFGKGGGILNDGALTLKTSTISNNRVSKDGGGIYNSGAVNMNNVTVTNNVADNDNNGSGDGGGILNFGGTANFKNSLLAGNIDTSGQALDCSGTLTSQGYNLIQNTSGCNIIGTTASNLIGVSPNLTPLQDNGGPTFTHALLVGSPAIDAGNPALPGSGGNACETTDQRSIARDGVCDIGAYEAILKRSFLPLLMRDYVPCINVPWEAEPNNDYQHANGLLCSGQDYYGYSSGSDPNGDRDYFSIYLYKPGQITVDLTNIIIGQAAQLQMYYQSATIDNRVAGDTVPPYQIVCPSVDQPLCTGAAGTYYILVYTPMGYSPTTPYTLRVIYP